MNIVCIRGTLLLQLVHFALKYLSRGEELSSIRFYFNCNLIAVILLQPVTAFI